MTDVTARMAGLDLAAFYRSHTDPHTYMHVHVNTPLEYIFIYIQIQIMFSFHPNSIQTICVQHELCLFHKCDKSWGENSGFQVTSF